MPAGEDALSERLPTRDEADKAKKAIAFLARHMNKRGTLRLKEGSDLAAVDLPPAISRLVLDLLGMIGKGDAVTLMSIGSELSTQQAADLLNVSRPFLVKLLEDKEIPHHKVGTHRRIRAEDLFEYKHRRDGKRADALTRLARLGQRIDA